MASTHLTKEAQSAYKSAAITAFTAGKTPTGRPRAIIIAGQPGAGKGGIARKAEQEFGSNCVVVDPDKVREMHPDYAELALEDDRSAAEKTHVDASEAADALRNYAIEKNLNLVIDGTLKSPLKAEELVRTLKAAGYEVEVIALCVPPAVSWAGVIDRYEKDKREYGIGRWVPKDVHDAAVDGVINSLEALEKQGFADRIQIVNRQYELLYDCKPRTGVANRSAFTIREVYSAFSARGFLSNEASAGGILGVKMGAMLKCTFGTAPSMLNVPPINRVIVEGAPAATIFDHQPIINIMPFGACTSLTNPTVAAATSSAMGALTPMPCMPSTFTPWTTAASTIVVGNAPHLDCSSKCTCSWGGIIAVVDPGTRRTRVP